MTFKECHDVELGMQFGRRVYAHFEFAGLDPLNKLQDASLDVWAVIHTFQFR